MFKRKFQDRNKERLRAYGLRIGDIVELTYHKGVKELAEVVAYASDNNRIFIRTQEGHGRGRTAEECKLVTKVEDRTEERIAKEVNGAFNYQNKDGLGFLNTEIRACVKGLNKLFFEA